MKIILKRRELLKERTSSLNLTWSAFLDRKGRVSESGQENPRSLLSPYGSPNYASVSRLERAGAGVGHDYLNARYYDGARGQFLSEDPVFLGDPKSQNLKDPQSLNTYSYAEDNPIVRKDPSGKWYVQIGADVGVGPYSGGAGIRFNNQGIVGYYSAGGGLGLLVTAPIEFNSGNIDVSNSSLDISRGGTFAGGAAMTGSYGNTFNPSAPLQLGNNGKSSFGITAGIGAWVGQTYTQTIPIWNFNSTNFSSANTTQARYQAVQSYNTSSGATSNQNKLWTTPSGAVVTWSGQVVTSAPQSTQNTNKK